MYLQGGFKATVACLRAAKLAQRATLPGKASEDVETTSEDVETTRQSEEIKKCSSSWMLDTARF